MNRRSFLEILKERKTKKETTSVSDFLNIPVLEKEKSSNEQSFSIPMRPPVLAGLEPYTGDWGVPQISHLLRRTTFGAKYADVSYFKNMTMEQTVAEILTPFTGNIDEPVNDYNTSDKEDPIVAFGKSFIGAEYVEDIEGERNWSLKGWWLRRMINQDRSINEKMLLFWHNHIPVQFFDVFIVNWNWNYLQTLRTHSLGNFKEMMRAITIDTAMLFFLNGQFNHKDEPDENYARELQELFCIGKGPNAKYTEEDVQAMARVLTGWRMDWGSREVDFKFWAHDTDDKQFSSFYNNAVITGRSDDAGREELDELLDIIFDNEEVALFLCRKIYRFFVYHSIDEQTEQEVIIPLAEIFRSNNYEILPVLDKLFRSQHFFDSANQGAMLKSSVDYLVGLYREFNVQLPPEGELSDIYNTCYSMNRFLFLLQQSIGDPPNVAGWPAYYQIPQFDKHWVTTDTLPKRLQITDLILLNGIPSGNYSFPIDVIGVARQIPDVENPNALIDHSIEWLFGIEVNSGVKQFLKSILLSGQSTDSYWTTAWVQHISDPTNQMKLNVVKIRLIRFYSYLLHLEESQLS